MIKKFYFLLIIILGGLILVSCGKEEPTITETNFKNLAIFTEEPKQYEKLEFALFEKELKIAAGGNPYDYNYMKVMGEFKAPSGDTVTIPAFWYQHGNITFNENIVGGTTGVQGTPSTNPEEPQGTEFVQAAGNAHYRFRIMPKESGQYTYTLKVYKNNLLTETLTGQFNVQAQTKDYPGIIQVDKTNNHTLMYENGESYIPIGQNLAWYTSSTRKTVDYEVWFEKMAEYDMNISRIWLATWGYALHWGSSYNNYSERYAQLLRLDKTIELARNYDIKVMLVLNNHGQFSSITNAEWDKNPYNKVNGGPCEIPLDFFRLEEARTAYKNELLYIIARYGYSDDIMCWELFNEVDYIDSANIGSLAIKNWHNEMANFLKTNDPYHHLVSTSYKGSTGGAFNLASIDFTCLHSYDYSNKNINTNLPNIQKSVYDLYKKPVLQAELGINWQSGQATYNSDPEGISIKQGLWAGLMGGALGGAMNWWWDSQIHPYDQYYLFEGAAKYANQLDLTGSDYEIITNVDNIIINNSFVDLMGYRFNDRIYGYLYDETWTYYNYSNVNNKTNIAVDIPFTNGNYSLKMYNADTGELTSTTNLIVSDGIAHFVVNEVKYHIAFIIE